MFITAVFFNLLPRGMLSLKGVYLWASSANLDFVLLGGWWSTVGCVGGLADSRTARRYASQLPTDSRRPNHPYCQLCVRRAPTIW